jgi:hypothetical protein
LAGVVSTAVEPDIVDFAAETDPATGNANIASADKAPAPAEDTATSTQPKTGDKPTEENVALGNPTEDIGASGKSTEDDGASHKPTEENVALGNPTEDNHQEISDTLIRFYKALAVIKPLTSM